MKPMTKLQRERAVRVAMNKLPFHPCAKCGAMTNSEHHIPCIRAALTRKRK